MILNTLQLSCRSEGTSEIENEQAAVPKTGQGHVLRA